MERNQVLERLNNLPDDTRIIEKRVKIQVSSLTPSVPVWSPQNSLPPPPQGWATPVPMQGVCTLYSGFCALSPWSTGVGRLPQPPRSWDSAEAVSPLSLRGRGSDEDEELQTGNAHSRKVTTACGAGRGQTQWAVSPGDLPEEVALGFHFQQPREVDVHANSQLETPHAIPHTQS